MAVAAEVRRLLENLERLRAHVEAVRSLSATARDDVATVLHALVGGDGHDDGYGLVKRGFEELGLALPEVPAWNSEVPHEIDGQPVTLALRGSPNAGSSTLPLPDHLKETCVRFAIPGIAPDANWSYLDLAKKVRNKFGSHIDKKPPKWLEELRFYPAGDSDAVTFLLWRAAETTLTAVSHALVDAGVDAEPYMPADRYLNGIDLQLAYVLGRPSHQLDVRAYTSCANWASGNRQPLVGALFGDRPFVFGLEADGRLSLSLGEPSESVWDLADAFRLKGLPKVGRNDPCSCGSGRKFKLCHGR